MLIKRRKFVRVIKYLLAGATVFCVSWLACVSQWHAAGGWRRAADLPPRSTMRTIVAYSQGKQAEMNRPTPVTCDRLPVFPRVQYYDRNWTGNNESPSHSWQQVDGTRVSLYAAYYDERSSQRYVRILASFHGRNFSTEDTLYCQTRPLNADEETVEVVAAKPLEIWWHGWDRETTEVETPLLLSCPLTDPLNGPSVVSVVTQPCNDPTNAFPLKHTHNIKKRKLFTICVKDIKFNEDISRELVEWIETNKILGVDVIDVYVDEVTNETKIILEHYRDTGFIRLFQVPIKHKSHRSLWQKRRDHIITYNDCLYRNIVESEFIVPLDIDEVIFPKIARTWPELLNRLNFYDWKSSGASSIIIRNVFFFDFMQGINKYKSNDNFSEKNKIYIKRDDVRIEEQDNIEISEIKLVDNSKTNEVIDISYSDKALYKKYEERCGTELHKPKLLKHIIRSAITSPYGYYSKSWMLTSKVLTAFNHYPLENMGTSNSLGWPAPFQEVQLNHYKESCNTTVLVEQCALYGRVARIDRSALRLRRRLTRALSDAICTRIINAV